MSDVQEFADSLLTGTRLTKIEMKHDNPGGVVDLAPLVHVVTTEGQAHIAIIPDATYVAIAVQRILPVGAGLAYVGFCADAYVEWNPLDGSQELPARGELAKRFEAGDMTVKESLMVTAIEVKSGEVVMIEQHYYLDDSGELTFDEPNRSAEGDDAQGAVVDQLKWVARHAR